MKDYYIEFKDVEIPYPHTFTYRVSARSQGRALDFAWRELRKESKLKGRREQKLNISIVPMGKSEC